MSNSGLGRLALILVFSLIATGLYAQMTVTTTLTKEQLVNDVLLGGGITVSNVTWGGVLTDSKGWQVARFQTAGTAYTELGFQDGIIITSGDARGIPGDPYDETSGGLYFSSAPGEIRNDPDAPILASGGNDFNVGILEFDFVPISDSVKFRYVFGSEEYPEYNCTQYNDVFGFLLSGPGISGGLGFTNDAINLATLPGSGNYVGINSVNDGTSAGSSCTIPAAERVLYFNGETAGNRFDGNTVILTARAAVTPCETYHIKLLVADISDGAHNSGVFLEAKSFFSDALETTAYQLDGGMNATQSTQITEACSMAALSFQLIPTPTSDQTVNYTIGGTATNGIDYDDGAGNPLSGSFVIAAGQDSVNLIINPLIDGAAEGDETVTITYSWGVGCGGSNTETVTYTIHDGVVPMTVNCGNIQSTSIDFSWSAVSGATGYDIVYTVNGGPDITDNTTATTYTAGSLNQGDVVAITVTPTGDPCFVSGSASCNTEACSADEGILVNNSQGPAVLSANDTIFSCFGETIELGHQTGSYTLTGVVDEMIYFAVSNDGSELADRNDFISAYNTTADVIDGSGPDPLASGPDNNIITFVNDGSTLSLNTIQHIYGTSGYPDNAGSPYASGTANFDFTCSFFSPFVVLPMDEITATITNDCGAGTITLNNIIGGLPELQSLNSTELPSSPSYTQYTVVLSGPTSSPNQTAAYNGSASFTGLAPGVYSVTITDGNGCPKVFNSIKVSNPSVNAAITSDYNGQEISCFGAADGEIECTPNQGIIPYSYSWSHNAGLNSNTASGLSAANNPYTVTITDGAGCTAVESISLAEPAQISAIASVTSDYNGNQITCAGASDGAVTVSVTNQTGSVSYLWDGPAGFTFSDNTLQNQAGLIAGTYSVTVSDANGCAGSGSVTISEPVGMVLATNVTSYYNGTEITCFGAADGAIDLTVTNGASGFTYSWTGPTGYTESVEDISGLAAGTYSITVTDANGCTAVGTQTITEPSAVTPGITVVSDYNGEALSCFGASNGSIIASGTGGTSPYTYSWSELSGYSLPNNTLQDQSGIPAGTYVVTITDANGCTGTSSQTLTNPAQINSAISITSAYNGEDISCFAGQDGAVNLIAAGGSGSFTYNWSGPVGYTFSDPTQEDQSALIAGDYFVTITDGNGCSTVNSVNLTQPAAMSATLTISDSHCTQNDGSADAQISGGTAPYSYLWSNGETTSVGSSMSAGTYTLTVTDANSCTLTTNANVSDLDGGSIQLLSQINNTCFNQSNGEVSVTMNGGVAPFSYSWNTGSTDTLLTNLSAGNYTLNVTDNTGCIASLNVSITQPPLLTAGITAYSNAACNGETNGSATVSALGGAGTYTYLWDSSTGNQTTSTATGLQAGTYSVTVSDDSLCVAVTSVTITEPAQLSSAITLTSNYSGFNISCNGLNNGSLNTATAGGTVTYSYSWSGPGAFSSGLANLSNLYAGTYLLTVTDANGCTYTTSTTLDEPQALIATTESLTDYAGMQISCSGSNDGSAAVTYTGGVSAYTFNWTGPAGFNATTDTLENLATGSYYVTVTDANSCSATNQIILNAPAAITVTLLSGSDFNGYSVSCYGTTDGSLESSVTGGTPGYTFSWNGPTGFTSNESLISNLSAGNYALQISDTNGCTIDTNWTLTQPDMLEIVTNSVSDYNSYGVSCLGENNGAINISTTGGVSSLSFSWSGPGGFNATTEDISGLYSGIYSLAVTDANGCSVSNDFDLTEPSALNLNSLSTTSFNGYQVSCFGSNNGAVDLTVSGGVSSYSFSWTGPAGFSSQNEDVNTLIAGSYQVTISDANGCTLSQSVTLYEPVQLTVNVQNPDALTCYGDANGIISADFNGGVLPYNLYWSNGTETLSFTGFSASISDLTAGQYTITVSDDNGCSATGQTGIIEPDAVVLTLSSDNILCNGDKTGSITAQVQGGTLPYDYELSNGTSYMGSTQTEITFGSLIALSDYYVVTITDVNGCMVTDSVLMQEPAMFVIDDIVTENVSCFGERTGFIQINASGGTLPYYFEWEGYNAYNTLLGIGAGVYPVAVTDENYCKVYLDTIVITQPDEISLDYDVTETSCLLSYDGAISLQVSGGTAPYAFIWSNGSPQQSLENVQQGIYTVSIADANGCLDTLSVGISYNDEMCVEIPSAFSPNDDNANDTWGIRYIELFENVTVEIFNRWGQLMFAFEGTGQEYSDPANQWDGYYNNKELPAGGYLYVVVIDEIDVHKGIITLIR